jgi:hypothetical protein
MHDFLDAVESAVSSAPLLAYLCDVVRKETDLDQHLAEAVAIALQSLREWVQTSKPSLFIEVDLPGILALYQIQPVAIGKTLYPSAIQAVIATTRQVVDVSTSVLGDTETEWSDELVCKCWPRLRDRLWGIAGLCQFPNQDQVQMILLQLRQELSVGAVDRREQSLTPGNEKNESEHTDTPTSKTKCKPGINARMLETIQNDPDSIGWSSPKWAKHLKCAKSSVVETQAWKDLAMGRERTKAERTTDRRRRP